MTLMQKWFWAIAVIVNPVMVLISFQYWAPGFWVVGALSLYTAVGLYDLFFSRHTLNRLYPVAAYCRYALEYIRPEIRQYFIASNTDELPFSREARNLVYRRAQKVANFQRNTLSTFFEMVGAMGLDDPNKLAPHHIWRRVEDESMRYFDEIYNSLAENELLGDKIEGPYSVEWAVASAETFAPQPTSGSRAIHRSDI